jgi:hypothetical protein
MLCDPRRFSSLVAGKNGKVINMQMIWQMWVFTTSGLNIERIPWPLEQPHVLRYLWVGVIPPNCCGIEPPHIIDSTYSTSIQCAD